MSLTLRELCLALADELAVFAPCPPPDRLRFLIDVADDYAPDPDTECAHDDDEDGADDEDGGDWEPSLGWACTMARGEQTGLDLELEHDGREPEHHG